jgi:hypothetical protein
MEDVLAVYTRPRDGDCPLVCLDETSKQLIAETRMPISMKAGRPARFDYEYERNVVGEAFLMQLHRSRPDPRLSTFERCWLSGATGLAQRTGDTRDLFALRSPGSVSPLCPTCAPVKANGAARKAREPDKCATETRLRGWPCRTRTQKCRRKTSH